MKKFILMLSAFTILIGKIAGQTGNYYEYTAKMNHYYDSLRAITPDTLKVPGMRSFQRWSDFWRHRVYNSPTITGSYAMYEVKMDSTIKNPLLKALSDWNWTSVDDNTNTHNKGLISSLWVNPLNIDEIYAGSNTAGMYRTVNGGTTWECVTDNLNILPSMGVNDIAVHPTNTSIKYIAVSSGKHNSSAYIFKTTDNCASWQAVLIIPLSENLSAQRIVIDPENSQIIYALMQDRVYRSAKCRTILAIDI